MSICRAFSEGGAARVSRIQVRVLVGGLCACSSPSSPGDAASVRPAALADAATTLDAGDAADGASVDASDDGSAARCWPPCLAALKERCGRPLVGNCVKQDQSFCYSNGIKEVVVNGDAGTSFAFYNASGLCASASLMGGRYVYRDGMGATVATLTEKTAGDPYSDTTVACGGTEVVVPGATLYSASCRTINQGNCTAGVCQ